MFDRIERARLEDLHFRHDPVSHRNAAIAIHNTRLDPALGGILNNHTIPILRCPIVAGAANNQLAHDRLDNVPRDRIADQMVEDIL